MPERDSDFATQALLRYKKNWLLTLDLTWHPHLFLITPLSQRSPATYSKICPWRHDRLLRLLQDLPQKLVRHGNADQNIELQLLQLYNCNIIFIAWSHSLCDTASGCRILTLLNTCIITYNILWLIFQTRLRLSWQCWYPHQIKLTANPFASSKIVQSCLTYICIVMLLALTTCIAILKVW